MMSKRLSVSIAASLLLLSMAPVGSTFAAPPGQSATVVAGGLASPRGLTIGPDGNLYVAESGSGGDQVIKVGEGDQASEVHLGNTGKITRISMDGTKATVASNLPSASSAEGEATGPEGVLYANGALWTVTTGAEIGLTPRPNDGSLLKIDPASGAVQNVANLQTYENTNNPDGFAKDSDPYGLALGKDGMVYVADAAANDVLKVDPSSGQINLVAVTPGLPLPAELQNPQSPFAQGNPDRKGAMEIDPVPTSVLVAPDGNMYVGLLSGFPFLQGGTKVLHVGSDGKLSDAATGLTMVVALAYGPDNMIYASEFGQFSLTSNPPGFTPNSGRIVRFMPGGTTQVVADGLNEPNGLAFDASGNLYVAENSTSATDGRVVRVGNVLTNPVVGMPRTGQSLPLEPALLASLLLVALGTALVLTADKFSARRA